GRGMLAETLRSTPLKRPAFSSREKSAPLVDMPPASIARLLDRLPPVTLAMSLPLVFSWQLKKPPAFFHGLSFIALWTWGLLAIVAVPTLVVIECVVCFWLLRHRAARRSRLSWHVSALFVAVLAEVVFVMARNA